METMSSYLHKSFHFSDYGQIGEIRRFASQAGKKLGLSEITTAQIEIIINELGSNVIKHSANAGEILITTKNYDCNQMAIEILCLDQGLGINDIEAVLEDNVSNQRDIRSRPWFNKTFSRSF